MTIKVLLFGHYRAYLPNGERNLEVEIGTTVADIAQDLARQEPRLSELLSKTRFGVNADFAPETQVLQDGDEVAFLPPMSGG